MNKLNEKNELEPLIIDCLDKIENGLEFLDEQLSLGECGRLDVLAVDKDGSFVILELKSHPVGSSIVFQALQYYECLLNNIEEFKRAYNVDGEPGVRLILVAPEFNPAVYTVLKHIKPEVEFREYTVVSTAGRPDLIIKPVNSDYKLRPLSLYHAYDVINNIKDNRVRVQFVKCLDFLVDEGFSIEMRNAGNQLIEVFHQDPYNEGMQKGVCMFETKQQFFRSYILEETGQGEKMYSKYREFSNFYTWKHQHYGYILNYEKNA
jgi:hypothetical protein